MTDPTLWGDAVSQVIWAYYLANFAYGFGVVLLVFLTIIGLFGLLYLIGLVLRKTQTTKVL